MKRLIPVSIILMIFFTISGCEPGSITVGAQLSAPYYERPLRPGPDYVWIDGDWYIDNGRYVYRHGYWARPRRGHVWITGTWEQRNGGWYWRKGRWDRNRRY